MARTQLPRVAVVTDSTAHIPGPVAEAAGVTVVPVHVISGDRTYREDVDIDGPTVARLLRSGQSMSTSRPAPAEFAETYERLAHEGYAAVVSIHLSGSLSGTLEGAQLAARAAPIPVRVVDTRTVAMAAGFGVLDAAAAAAAGADVDTCVRAAETTAQQSRLFFCLDTLEFLQKGGRIGTASRYLGQALRIKPLLQIADGRVEALEKVRTSNRALRRLAEVAIDSASDWPRVRVAVHELDAVDAAGTVVGYLRQSGSPEPMMCGLGAVLGVHTGPGLVAVAVAPEAPGLDAGEVAPGSAAP